MTIQASNFPTVMPALTLDLTRSQYLDPRITFSRASIGTFVDSRGILQTAPVNVARFDHNPTTGESLGLLVEEQRTNLLTYSDAILSGNGYGVNVSTLATITTATPTGSATASLFTMNVGANTGNNTDGFNFSSSITLTNSTQHTQSLFVKPAGATVLRLRSNISGLVVDFTLTGNGTAPSPISDLQSASIVALANGWYRVSWTFTTTTSAPGNRSDYWTIKTNVADGTNGLYVVGAQLEAGAFATSYIPTTTAAATRSADVASITGTAFSSWYRQDEGSIYALGAPRYNYGGVNTFPRIFSISNGTTTTMIDGRNRVLSSFSDSGYAVADGGATQATYDSASNTAGQAMCIAYRVNSFALSIGGALSDSDTSGTVPTVDRMTLGNIPVGSTSLNGTIRRLTFWPQRLGNSMLQTIT